MSGLHGRRALVTGGASGIGAACARDLAARETKGISLRDIDAADARAVGAAGDQRGAGTHADTAVFSAPTARASAASMSRRLMPLVSRAATTAMIVTTDATAR